MSNKMFSPINKQVTSKFRSSNTQEYCYQKPTYTKSSPTLPQVPVEPNQLHSLRRGARVKNVAKTVAAAPAASAPKLSAKTSAKQSVEEQKHASCPNIREVVAKEKTAIVAKTAGVTPRVSPRKSATTKIVAFGSTLSSKVAVVNYPRHISNSDDSDFKLTNPAYKPTMSSIFSYDLSPLERNDYGTQQETHLNPMKLVPPTEVQLLKDGQRSTYLERRYQRTPDAKYNYPEATSMRYGWFHHLGDPNQRRVARRD